MLQRAPFALTALALLGLGLVPTTLGSHARSADYPFIYVVFHAQGQGPVTVTLGDGTPVGTLSGAPTVIPPGTYNVSISDPSFNATQTWDLAGPGVKLVTNMSYGEEASEAWVESFQANATYTYRDDLNPGPVWTFVTSNAPPVGTANSGSAPGGSTTTTGGKAPSIDIVGSGTSSVPFRGTLLGAVSSTGKLALTTGGKPVRTLKAGEYTFKVTDKSKKAGFEVQEVARSGKAVTGTSFVGTRSAKIDLEAGQWFFYPTFVGKKTYFIVVT